MHPIKEVFRRKFCLFYDFQSSSVSQIESTVEASNLDLKKDVSGNTVCPQKLAKIHNFWALLMNFCLIKM